MKKFFIILFSLFTLLILLKCTHEKPTIEEEKIQTISFYIPTQTEEETTIGQTIVKRKIENTNSTREEKEKVVFEVAETVNSETVPIQTLVVETYATSPPVIEEPQPVITETAPPAPTTAAPQSIYLGNYRITFYCPGSCCCGKWAGGGTASGVMPTAGITIACEQDIPFGTTIHIEGIGTYVCQDRGVGSGYIDIFVNSHAEIPSWGEGYFPTYIVTY